ncbi:hypothetical protein SD81_006210 [Tolypothrix campylonemoides VB511288]|nr:hypothetical protein SD81_006210 [Tolypothrix campylonemoides VB511288]
MVVDNHISKVLELEECKDMIFKIVRLIRKMKLERHLEQLENFETELIRHASILTDLQFKEILTDLKEPGDRIKAVTNKLEDAIEELQQINQLIGILSGVLDLVGKIVSTIAAGNPPVVIATLLNGLEKLSA